MAVMEIKAIVAITAIIPTLAFASAPGAALVSFENRDFKAKVPAGFVFEDLKQRGSADLASGYFHSPDDSVRFYIQRSMQVSLFLRAKSEGIEKATFRVTKEDRGGTGVWGRTELVIRPVDEEAFRFRRYLTIETATEAAGGAWQFGIQVPGKAERKKWEPLFNAFMKSLEFKHDY